MEEELATVVQNTNASRYLSGMCRSRLQATFTSDSNSTAAGFVVLLYDHVLTFDDEVEYVWKARMSLPKFLFLFNRYLVPTLMVISTYEFSGFAGRVLPDSVPWLSIALYLGILCVSNTNFVVLLRLWVLWDRWRNLVVWTLLCFIFTHLATFGMVTWVVVQLQPVAQYDTTVHSCVLSRHIWMEGLWVPGVLFETTVFIGACWNAMARPRESNELLTRVLYRDALRLMNLTLAIVAPLSLTFLSLFFVFCSTNLTFSRLVLNLRRASASDASADCMPLRTDHEASPSPTDHDHMQMKVVATTPTDSPCESSPLECISEETIVEEPI
ncbi:hypothetical protein DENSPDRAFT_839774 [Dentipellis sp. KUC8613]|nr:hypothetical protein DENSPDRAFT_839774 [Dentipellis sp. KUC8613]